LNGEGKFHIFVWFSLSGEGAANVGYFGIYL